MLSVSKPVLGGIHCMASALTFCSSLSLLTQTVEAPSFDTCLGILGLIQQLTGCNVFLLLESSFALHMTLGDRTS